jgi:hypothetical protein
MRHARLLTPMLVVAGLVFSAGTATASQPARFGPFVDTYEFTVDCGTFEATVSGTSSTRVVAFFDASGNVTRVEQFIRAPADVWLNPTTGKSIVVRGEFQQTYRSVPGTDQITVTVVGFRYIVNQPGSGVTVQEVGRIVYGEPTEETVLALAGQHDLADQAQIDPVFCAALA